MPVMPDKAAFVNAVLFCVQRYRRNPSMYRRSQETSKWEGLTQQVGWELSKREGRFRVWFGVGQGFSKSTGASQ